MKGKPSVRTRAVRAVRKALIKRRLLDPVIPDLEQDGQIAENFDVPEVVYEQIEDPRFERLAAQDSIKRHVAFILITFRGSTLQPPSNATVQAEFLKTYDFFESLSYGATFLTGEVFGPFVVDKGTNACDWSSWINQAKQRLAATGVNLTTFTNFVVIGPRDSSCGFGGIASIGGNWTYMNGTIGWSILAHELGHNFGLRHAKTPTDEYGDPYDRMGNGLVGFHAQYRYRMGVLTAGDVIQPTVSGNLSLYALEVKEGFPKLLRLLRPDGSYLTVETRRAVGPYAPAAGSSAVQGLLIRTVTSTGNSATLIDTQSDTSSQGDAALLPEQIWTDPLSGITIRHLSRWAKHSRVKVTLP